MPSSLVPLREYRGRIIGLTGYAQSGKDTIYKEIVRHRPGAERAAFADALKRELAGSLDLPIEKVEARKRQCRMVLVALGEYCRKLDRDYWIDRCLVPAHAPMVVVTDVRYPNEAMAIVANGGSVFYVYRDNIIAANPDESQSIAQICRDFTPRQIYNHEGEPTIAAKRILALAWPDDDSVTPAD